MAEIVIAINNATATTPSTGNVSLYPKADSRFYMKDANGEEVRLLTDEVTLTTLTASAPLQSSGGTSPNISITNATSSAAGAMSSADKTKLDAATALNNTNTILLRDALGKVAANTFIGSLQGTATTCLSVPSLTGHVTTNGTTNQTTIVSGVINNSMIAANAAIDLAKLAINPLDRANHTGAQPVSSITGFDTAIGDYLSNSTAGRVVNTHIAPNAAITLNKLAVNPLDRTLHIGTQPTSSITNFSTAVGTIVSDALTAFSITNDNIDANAGIVNSKLATNPLLRTNHTGTQTASTISDLATVVPSLITVGSGLAKAGNQLSAVGTSDRISVSNSGIDIATNYVGQTSINTLGTITTGAWLASLIGVNYGGTGAATAAGGANNLRAVQTINGNTNLNRGTHQLVLVDTNLGGVTLTLPVAGDGAALFRIKKTSADANTVTINVSGTNTIEGVVSKTLSAQYQYITLANNGTTWFIVSGAGT